MTFFNMLLMLPQEAAADEGLVNVLVQRFNEGGDFMWPVLISLIIGLEELLETSVVVMALRDEKARQETEKNAEKPNPDASD